MAGAVFPDRQFVVPFLAIALQRLDAALAALLVHPAAGKQLAGGVLAALESAEQGADVSGDELLAFYEGKTAKGQIPDDVIFVDAIPLGATGKMQKMNLRATLKDYKLPTA